MALGLGTHMPTRSEWLQALRREHIIQIESSQDLCDEMCDEINMLQQWRDQDRRAQGLGPLRRKRLAPWPLSGSPRQDIRVRPIDFLHALGRITTPPITELIDLSSTWAERRYIWAFAPSRSLGLRRMRLSEPVKHLDFHQKALFSDEFGVRFAAHYMASCERASNPVSWFCSQN
jgi:hypothetical protein